MSKILRAFIDNEGAIRRVFARYFSRSEDVDDLTQETFIKSFAAELKTDVREPKAFLLRVAKNLALSEVKKKSRVDTDYLEEKGPPEVLKDEVRPSVEDEYDARRKLAVFAQALASLPATHRQALLMRKMEHLRFKQIAKRLDVSVSTAEKRVASALVMCNAFLREAGYDPAEFGAASPASTKSGSAAVSISSVKVRKALNWCERDV